MNQTTGYVESRHDDYFHATNLPFSKNVTAPISENGGDNVACTSPIDDITKRSSMKNLFTVSGKRYVLVLILN